MTEDSQPRQIYCFDDGDVREEVILGRSISNPQYKRITYWASMGRAAERLESLTPEQARMPFFRGLANKVSRFIPETKDSGIRMANKPGIEILMRRLIYPYTITKEEEIDYIEKVFKNDSLAK